ncbi:MAG: hypothetical protein AAGC57_18325 [Pseudomonadota bacterium]
MDSYQELSATAGLWQSHASGAVVQYDPNLLDGPVSLIATLTHELMHDIHAPFCDTVPSGEEAHELGTDLHCITTGQGLNQTMAAEYTGWIGYLRQPTRGYALALFLPATGRPIDAGSAWLQPRPLRYLRRADREIATFTVRLASLSARLGEA